MKCAIVKDLLPGYVDGVTSSETNQAIEEHIETCSECREYLNMMRKDIVSEHYLESSPIMKKNLNPLKKFWSRTIVGMIALVAILAAGVSIVLYLMTPKSFDELVPEAMGKDVYCQVVYMGMYETREEVLMDEEYEDFLENLLEKEYYYDGMHDNVFYGENEMVIFVDGETKKELQQIHVTLDESYIYIGKHQYRMK